MTALYLQNNWQLEMGNGQWAFHFTTAGYRMPAWLKKEVRAGIDQRVRRAEVALRSPNYF